MSRELMADSFKGKACTDRFERVLSLFIALFPVLSIYGCGIPGITLGDFLLGILMLCYVIKYGLFWKWDSLSVPLILFVAYIASIGLINCAVVNRSDITDVAVRTIRMSFYLVSVLYITGRKLNVGLLNKYIQIVCLAASLFVFLQFLVYKMKGVVIPGYIDFLPVYHVEYTQIDYASNYADFFFRSTSFFLEPAHCARYLILGVLINLLSPNPEKKWYNSRILAGVFSMAIVVTTSGQGLFMLALVWMFFIGYALFCKSGAELRKCCLIYLVVGVVAFLAVFFMTDIISNTLSRVFNKEGHIMLGMSSGIGGRIGSISTVKDLSLYRLIFGSGYGYVPGEGVWQSGITYYLNGTGIVGCLLMLSTLFLNCKLGGAVSKCFSIVLLVLFFIDDSYSGYMMVFYLPYLLTLSKEHCGKDYIFL